MPHLRRSDTLGLIPQPFRAGLTFGSRPSGPRIHGDCRCHFSLNLLQASRLLGMTKGRAMFPFVFDAGMSQPQVPIRLHSGQALHFAALRSG